MDATMTMASKSKMTVFTNDFSKEVYDTKYRYANETINETIDRVAKAVAAVESDKKYWYGQFKSLLQDFKFIPGGRILSNAGLELGGTTLINCYVSGFQGSDRDSMESILDELRRQALILKSEGGYGFCVDTLRPRYSFIAGIGSESPGAVKMLDMWDTQSDVITSGSGKKSGYTKAKSGIRKGAQMVTMSIWHPDIEEFITAKQTAGRLTKFNMSVLVTDKFMQAARNHQPWHLEFPDLEAEGVREKYKAEWDGNLESWKAKGYPVRIFKTYEDASELWNMITNATYTRNEPGILFVDRMNYWNNLSYLEHITSTNPCVTEGTLVNTPNGYRRVETIREKDMVCTVLGKEPVETIEIHDDTDVFKVTFSDGGEEIVTAAHQYHAKRSGAVTKYYTPVRLDELKIGDVVRVETTPIVGLNDYDEKQYYMGLRAGVLLGDGCCTNNTVQTKIAVNSSEIEYNAKVKWLFGEDSFIADSPGEGLSTYFIFKKDAVNVEELGVTRGLSYEKHINYEFVNNAGYILGVLDGLLATDGNVNLKSNHPAIRFNTTSKQLAQDIRRLLLCVGCYSTISKSFDDSGSIGERKIIRRHIKYTVNVSGASFKTYYAHSKLNVLHAEKYDKMKKAVISCGLSGNHGCAAIKDIEYVGKQKVYDLYCSESDTWITSGYVQRGCGEQILPVGGVCLLGSINLTQFVSGTDFDYDKLGETVKLAVRFMDNVNDITYVPLQEQRENLIRKRRIGLGIMGYASALLMMKKRYGSPDALEMTDRLMSFITNAAYCASAELAGEKGAFPDFDVKKYMQSNFVKTLRQSTRELIKRTGMRNSHLMSVQPTGNTSSLANVVSGGLEPIFRPEYVRTMVVAHWPDGMARLYNVDFVNKKFDVEGDANVWSWIKEGDENILYSTFSENGKDVIYKFDSNRGLTKESVVMDYGVAKLKEIGQYDEKADYVADAAKLSIDDHINTMTTIAKYIDSAMSKTINVPSDFSFEDFKQIYDRVYDSGIVKGCTTYRDGTMTSVLSELSATQQQAQPPHRLPRTHAPKRPKVLECDIHHMTIGGDKWLVFVGLYGEYLEPYEVFAFKRNGIQISTKVTSGKMVKVKQRNHQTRYDLHLGEVIIEDICKHFKADEESALTRQISMALRNGIDIDHIYDQLMKSEGTVVSFSKAIARSIKTYVKTLHHGNCSECGAENSVIMSEGCMKCTNCGASKCS